MKTETKRYRKQWTKEEEDKLTKLYPTTSNRTLAQIFDVKIYQIESKAARLTLRKAEGFLTGREPFAQGTITTLKGMPHAKYNGRWILLRKYNWLMAGREVPKGYIVVAIGDKEDYSVENSRLITRGEKGKLALDQRKGNKVGRKKKEIAEVVKPVKQPKVKVKKPVKLKPVKVREIAKPVPKKTVTRYETKTVDVSKLIPVKIDRKTTIYTRKGEDVEQVKERFMKTYKQSA